MEQSAAFDASAESTENGLIHFERWFKLTKKPDTDRAYWCRLVMGQEVNSTLHLEVEEATYAVLRAKLEEELGDKKPQETASHQVAMLVKGELSCIELAR